MGDNGRTITDLSSSSILLAFQSPSKDFLIEQERLRKQAELDELNRLEEERRRM
jgi:hypothetical protein